MKKKKNTFTLMIIPHSEHKPTTINIPIYAIRFVSVLFIIGITFGFNWYYHYVFLREENSSLQVVKSENEVLKDEYIALFTDIEHIKSRMIEIEELEEKVRTKNEFDPTKSYFTKNNQKVMAKIEGKNKTTVTTLSLKDAKKTVETLKEASLEKDSSLKALEVQIDDKNDKLSHIPSIYPTYGRITSRFGQREDPFNNRSAFHNALDIANSYGTPIYAAAAGKVVFAGYDGGYGKKVMIRHSGIYSTIYGHNSKIIVKDGEYVEKGQLISYMGSTGRSTGPHLHFEVLKYGKSVDPLQYIDY